MSEKNTQLPESVEQQSNDYDESTISPIEQVTEKVNDETVPEQSLVHDEANEKKQPQQKQEILDDSLSVKRGATDIMIREPDSIYTVHNGQYYINYPIPQLPHSLVSFDLLPLDDDRTSDDITDYFNKQFEYNIHFDQTTWTWHGLYHQDACAPIQFICSLYKDEYTGSRHIHFHRIKGCGVTFSKIFKDFSIMASNMPPYVHSLEAPALCVLPDDFTSDLGTPYCNTAVTTSDNNDNSTIAPIETSILSIDDREIDENILIEDFTKLHLGQPPQIPPTEIIPTPYNYAFSLIYTHGCDGFINKPTHTQAHMLTDAFYLLSSQIPSVYNDSTCTLIDSIYKYIQLELFIKHLVSIPQCGSYSLRLAFLTFLEKICYIENSPYQFTCHFWPIDNFMSLLCKSLDVSTIDDYIVDNTNHHNSDNTTTSSNEHSIINTVNTLHQLYHKDYARLLYNIGYQVSQDYQNEMPDYGYNQLGQLRQLLNMAGGVRFQL